MKDSLEMKSGESFSLEVRKNDEVIEKTHTNKKYLIKNHKNVEVEYSYALYKEN